MTQSSNFNKRMNLRVVVRGAYDEQKLRIQMGNRIVGNFKAKLGQAPSSSEDTMDAQGKQILADLRRSFKKITDGIKKFPKEKDFTGDSVISDYTELCLVRQYVELENNEKTHFQLLDYMLTDFDIYKYWLYEVRGIGPAMAGVIISEIDITKAKYVSSIWRYAGLDVAEDGRGRSRRKEHLISQSYVDRDGNEQTKLGITFNPFLKTKLTGVLGSSFLRAGGDNKYATIYKDYKHRLENHEAHKEKTKLHRHNMAIRYMIKMFLADLYKEWRPLERLPVEKTYHEAKLGHKHCA